MPLVGSSNPNKQSARVVLPEPEEPIIAKVEPEYISNEILLMAGFPDSK